jgi:hypothetical protein
VHGWRVERLRADKYNRKCPKCGHEVQTQERAKVKLTEDGTPDYLALRFASPPPSAPKWLCRFPRAFYLELKRPGGKLRKAQEIWIEDARKRGIPVCVADGIDALTEYMEREEF